GIYSLAISISLLLFTIIDTSMNSALLKYSSGVELGKNKKAGAYFRYLLGLKIKYSLVLAVLILIFAYPTSIFIFKKPQLFFPLILSAVYIIFLSMESFFSSLFFIFNDLKILFFKETFFQVLRVGLILLVPILFIKRFYVVGSFLVLITSMFIIFLLVFSISKKKYPTLYKSDKIKLNKSTVKNFIFYIAIGGVSAMVFSYIDILMLGAFIPDSSFVGFYRAATTLVFSIAGLLTFSNVLLPKFSEIKKEKLGFIVNSISRYLLILSVPATFGFLALGKFIIRAIYGYDYLNAFYPLLILSLIIPVVVMSGLFYSVLSARGKPDIYTKASSISLLVNVVLNYIFIKLLMEISFLWAIIGAGTATTISYSLYVGILIFNIKKSFGIKFQSFLFFKPLFASIIMYLLLIYINGFIEDMTLFIGAFEIIFSIAFYFLIMFLIKGINKDDFKFFNIKDFLS
ncbi:MAG: polysaccharide biosynthesis C-terminal domain-containing protein, partial [Candidatus Nanoarchaeia archaeon]